MDSTHSAEEEPIFKSTRGRPLTLFTKDGNKREQGCVPRQLSPECHSQAPVLPGMAGWPCHTAQGGTPVALPDPERPLISGLPCTMCQPVRPGAGLAQGFSQQLGPHVCSLLYLLLWLLLAPGHTALRGQTQGAMLARGWQHSWTRLGFAVCSTSPGTKARLGLLRSGLARRALLRRSRQTTWL